MKPMHEIVIDIYAHIKAGVHADGVYYKVRSDLPDGATKAAVEDMAKRIEADWKLAEAYPLSRATFDIDERRWSFYANISKLALAKIEEHRRTTPDNFEHALRLMNECGKVHNLLNRISGSAADARDAIDALLIMLGEPPDLVDEADLLWPELSADA